MLDSSTSQWVVDSTGQEVDSSSIGLLADKMTLTFLFSPPSIFVKRLRLRVGFFMLAVREYAP